MLFLIQNWNIINFKNYELVKDNNWNFSIIINEKVKVQYVHYIFDPNAKTVQMHCNVRGDIKYCKIWEYIIQKYEERLNRMLKKKEEPSNVEFDNSYVLEAEDFAKKIIKNG